MGKTLLIALSWALLLASQLAVADTLIASVDRNRVSVEETLQLRLRYSGQQIDGEPDFSQLQQDFDILSKQQSSQLRIINGQRNDATQWSLTLAPRRQGQLLIPSFSLNGNNSETLKIEVGEAGSTKAPGRGEVFARASLSKNQAYVGEEVLLSLKLYFSVSVDELNMSELEIPGVHFKALGQQPFQEVVDGIDYRGLEVQYALYPEHQGSVEIPAVVFTATANPRGALFNPFGQQPPRGRTFRPRTQALSLEVLPKAVDGPWLPARSVTLNQRWSADISQISAGQPITRTITLSAEGVESSQLQPLPRQEIPGLKQYPDQAQLDDQLGQHGSIGQRTESTAWVASRPGTYHLPAVELQWWNTEAKRLETAVLPKQTLVVSAPSEQSVDGSEFADPAPPAQALPPEDKPSVPDARAESYASYLLLASNLAFLLLWLNSRTRLQRLQRYGQLNGVQNNATSEPRHKSAAKAVERAARANRPADFRKALLHWAQLYWEPLAIRNLRELPVSPSLQSQLAALEQELYGPEGNGAEQDLRKLWQALKQQHAAITQAGDPDLPGLYPSSRC